MSWMQLSGRGAAVETVDVIVAVDGEAGDRERNGDGDAEKKSGRGPSG